MPLLPRRPHHLTFPSFFSQDLSTLGVVAVLAVQLLGYYMFRGANGQKDTFR